MKSISLLVGLVIFSMMTISNFVWATSADDAATPSKTSDMVKMEFDLTLESKDRGRSELIGTIGEKSVISVSTEDDVNSYFIEVTPTRVDRGENGIQLEMQIGTLQSGKREVLFSPRIISFSGHEAEIEVGQTIDEGESDNASSASKINRLKVRSTIL